MGNLGNQLTSQPRDFVLYLQQVLAQRIEKNPRYSLRAFAQGMRVDSSMLSKVFRGERRVSKGFFLRAVDRLSLTPEQVDIFAKRLGFQGIESQPAQTNYLELDTDHFRIISDWYHFALFELMRVKDFKSTLPWITKALGITRTEARLALLRMERVGLIQRQNGKWKRIDENITNHRMNFTEAARRRFQRQILERAIDALETVHIESRDQSSMTMAVDTKTLTMAKELIMRFRRDLSDVMQQTKKFDAVYQLSISLFPLTRKDRGI